MSLLAVGGILFLITNMQVQEPSFRLEKLKKITVSFDQSANYFLDYSTAYKMSENVILSVQVGFFLSNQNPLTGEAESKYIAFLQKN